MGKLLYGNDGLEIDFDDRTLLHLEFVIRSKLRLGQPFCLNWTDWESVREGPSMLWFCSQVPVSFSYDGAFVQDSLDAPRIKRLWITAMMATADESAGLVLRREPVLRGRFWPRPWKVQY